MNNKPTHPSQKKKKQMRSREYSSPLGLYANAQLNFA
jgi:hypothetical protein